MAGHARLSPSSADRWMLCPGAVVLEDGLPDTSNDNSDSGTATHFLAEQCLTTNTHPASFIGRKIQVGVLTPTGWDGATWDVLGNPDWKVRFETVVDAEREIRANAYVQAVKKLAEGAVFASYEHKVDISAITGEEDASGTTDTAIVTADRELQVHDLKDGHGPVAAEQNRQLRIYALGLYDELSAFCDIDRVRLFIHQPRLSHTADEAVVSLEDLELFRHEVEDAADKCVMAAKYHTTVGQSITREEWSDKFLNPGEKQCQWCKAKATCPKLAAFVEASVGAEFEDITEGNAPFEAAAQHPGVSDDDLGAKMAACDLIEDWIKAVRAEVSRRLFASTPVPGYKLVQGKKGARAWRDEAEAETVLKTMRLKVEEMYDMKVISPPKVEKIFGEKGSAPSVKRWNKLQALITQKDGSPSVAPESDKRPALVLDAAADFEDESGSDLA